jgi:hypothetical protein
MKVEQFSSICMLLLDNYQGDWNLACQHIKLPETFVLTFCVFVTSKEFIWEDFSNNKSESVRQTWSLTLYRSMYW